MALTVSTLPYALVALTDADACGFCPVLREGVDILDGATISYRPGKNVADIVIPTWRQDSFPLGQEIDIVAPTFLRFQGKARIVRIQVDLAAEPPCYTQTLTLRA